MRLDELFVCPLNLDTWYNLVYQEISSSAQPDYRYYKLRASLMPPDVTFPVCVVRIHSITHEPIL